jgi:hypothetical protein
MILLTLLYVSFWLLLRPSELPTNLSPSLFVRSADIEYSGPGSIWNIIWSCFSHHIRLHLDRRLSKYPSPQRIASGLYCVNGWRLWYTSSESLHRKWSSFGRHDSTTWHFAQQHNGRRPMVFFLPWVALFSMTNEEQLFESWNQWNSRASPKQGKLNGLPSLKRKFKIGARVITSRKASLLCKRVDLLPSVL